MTNQKVHLPSVVFLGEADGRREVPEQLSVLDAGLPVQ